MEKRFIEESFPVKEVSEESAKEKNIRHGHISTLHIWWARRPLASSRATNYAALIPEAKDEIDWVKKRNFIIELSKWENSLNQNIIEQAKKEIIEFNDGIPPKVLDPFSGGGAIPLEALRLGCESYANDYNPLAVLIEKCTLEYPQKYGNAPNKKWSESKNPLVEDIIKWGNWVFDETQQELSGFYPKKKYLTPSTYIWARTVPCQNPSCQVEIPLMRQFWLAKKKNKKIALKPIDDNGKIGFEIVGQNNKIPDDFDPSKGTVKRAVVQCPLCNSTIEANTTRKLFQEGKSGQKIVAIAFNNDKKRGKIYKLPDKDDIEFYLKSQNYLEKKRKILFDEWGFDPIPNEPIKRVPVSFGVINVWVYGITTWGELFNSRQKLAIITFIQNIKLAYKQMLEEGIEKSYAKIVTTYLTLMLGKLQDWNSVLSTWRGDQERNEHVFNRQALPMVWDYGERNPFVGTLMSPKGIDKVIENCTKTSLNFAKVTNSSATSLNYPDNFFDAIFTDPPYYDNVPYSYLSDFFYVWIKRTIGDLYPELFVSPLSPKKEEAVAYSGENGDSNVGKVRFENMISKSFQEVYRILKPGGIFTVVYAYKTTEGWETVINSILDSGLTVTASWPISTEMAGRLRAQRSAALASSIYIVARKYEKEELSWFKDVKEEIKNYVPQKLDKLWEEGISGADFFIAAIGSAIEIFGKYKKVLDNEGNEIRADKLLSFVRDVVSDYTVRQILHNGIADELSPLTKFYLMWRWNYLEARVPYDDARKLAQSAGIDLFNEWNKGFIHKKGEFIIVEGPDKRDKHKLKDSNELIDVLHNLCILWKEGKNDKMKQVLKQSGYGEGEAIYKVAQAISETLPNNSSEKLSIQGFLAGRDRFLQDMREDESQTKLV
ncbi:DUF1156 domain-containing protein [Methanobacterium formicicum]|uniref:DUF1156 domain-containing protein n=1 Tax=Methanobacterium formicicum TaxID=2162 RepID=A0A0S4FNZ1_METFO|nr:DUF1156 domain-containing protein [Methanobacterium formicicum]CEL24790.1 hypothetical protein MB9_1152 [Methanobacterium formicicum]